MRLGTLFGSRGLRFHLSHTLDGLTLRYSFYVVHLIFVYDTGVDGGPLLRLL